MKGQKDMKASKLNAKHSFEKEKKFLTSKFISLKLMRGLYLPQLPLKHNEIFLSS